MSKTIQTLRFDTPFKKGWFEGFCGIAGESIREVEAMHPQFNAIAVTQYLNGADDGRNKDLFRLSLTLPKGT